MYICYSLSRSGSNSVLCFLVLGLFETSEKKIWWTRLNTSMEERPSHVGRFCLRPLVLIGKGKGEFDPRTDREGERGMDV